MDRLRETGTTPIPPPSSLTTSEIRSRDEVQIYESIMVDANGAADHRTADGGAIREGQPAVAARIRQADRGPGHRGARRGGRRCQFHGMPGTGCVIRSPVNAPGPFEVEAELLYQPIGYRWANNLKKYDAPEPRRFNGYYDAMGPAATVRIAGATR